MTLAIVGGYRLVRTLGEGTSAVTWLGHPVDDSVPVAVKLYRAADPAPAAREMEALARAAGEHVVAVLDVATTSDGRIALILEQLRPESLATILALRGGAFTPGEAVTILAPLAAALDRMHRSGVTHGALSASAVGFTDLGAPVVMRFGSATSGATLTTAVDRERDPRFDADRAAFAALCSDVLDPVVDSGGVRQWLQERVETDDWLSSLGARLFAWAVPEPVAFGRADAATPRAVEPVLRRPRAPAQPVLALLDRAAGALSTDRVEWLRRQASTVRPRFWVAGGAAVLALVLGMALVPASAEGESSPSPTSTPTPAPSSGPAGDSGGDPAEAVIAGDDPAAAALVLLEARQRCIRDLSILCLDDVDQPGSSALDHDRELIRSVQAGGEVPPAMTAVDAVVVERMGGAAVVAVTDANDEPASILVMRSEAGWRVRDYLDED
ncbi:protein kinase domain-containing protein [Schumannella luteola]